ncbi:MAG: hypothetical protein BWY88_01315 [Synergistetes bacterium ADurb.Bin520]|nr:MAG: hypothetical protein BWY88_01315 [Synergistetes bacterium ADurb.Bin520]
MLVKPQIWDPCRSARIRGVTLVRAGCSFWVRVLMMAPPHPASKARSIISRLLVGGAEASIKGFFSFFPKNVVSSVASMVSLLQKSTERA